ncbi:hydroxymethylbilane synthase [Corynebacterium kutscheri]|uniref:Porphobilinogen deaminase n=1 Tax=Corynebacterium kutscheri TaxID=35755 RepID=A0A0F6R0K5_9CORY|nr:hydroxymethylbilane synthase [Corynebacterium kutscheri]AKE40483.1 hydroxymethylbilane synthase [Corynebacterium kutscheri]VEH10878.1 porphobilinogen deaminase [Corynebacterium kutscheri]
MFKIGTRGSLLATTQAGHIRDALVGNGFDSDLHIVTTVGDVNMAPVERIGVGVFTQKLRDALFRGECDIAVHSFKDLPTEPDARFRLIVPRRVDARDCLVARDSLTLDQLPLGAKVGTGAPRRISQLRVLRPDLEILGLRGNIDSRMDRVKNGELDAVVLAYAGLLRVERGDMATEVFSPEQMVPAPAQGALAIECRVDDQAAIEAINSILDEQAMICAVAERIVLNRLEAGCTAPVAAYAFIENKDIIITAVVVALDGTRVLKEIIRGRSNDYLRLSEELASKLIASGAKDILS